jgi:hypothetical protein
MQNNSSQKNVQLSLSGCLRPILLLILIIGAFIYGLRYWHSISEPSYIYYGSSFNPFSRNLYKLDFAFTDKGPIAWVYSYYSGGGKGSRYHQYQIDLIHPQTRQLIQRVPLDQTYSTSNSSDVFDYELINNQFFIFNKIMGVQWRNSATGALLGDEQTLLKKYPQLQAGIGEVAKERDKWFKITTKDGLKFSYSPDYERLLTEQDKKDMEEKFRGEKVDLSDKNVRLQYAWGLEGDLRKELYLVKQYKLITEELYPQSILSFSEELKREAEQQQRNEEYRQREDIYYKNYPEEYAIRMEDVDKRIAKEKLEREKRNSKNQQLINHVRGKIFLKGEVVYQDSSLCVVMHRSEVSEKVGYSLSCVEASGKIRWELKNPSIKILLPQKYEFSKHQTNAHRQGEQFVFISNAPQNIGMVMLDLKNGQVLWEYMPVR